MADVSVVVPIYNVKNYLEECMDSLTKQLLPNCEFLCIDDGSEDDSYKIVEKYMDKDKRFKLIRQENKGLAETRNVGIRNAMGKYIAFLDGDDYFSDSNILGKLYKKAEAELLEVISFETELLYEDNLKETENKDFYYYKKSCYNGIRKGKSFFIEMMENHEYCDSACLLFLKRKWVLTQEIMFYPGILYEDALFCIQCFLKAERMAHVAEKYYTYRIRKKSIMTAEIRWENVRSRIVLYREILQLLFSLKDNSIQLQNSIIDYLSLIAFHAKYLDDFRIDSPSDVFLESLDILLMKTMGVGKYRAEINENVILNGLEKLVADSEGVVLYGSGKVGRLFFRFLKDKGIDNKILCYAISKDPKERRNIDGIPVLPIQDAICKKGEIFLSVVEQKAQSEMKEHLQHLGITRFEVFDQYIYRALRHYIQMLDAGKCAEGDRCNE